nr:MAG TPA: hypothetical protein [Caudoviricetes sp.]
MTDATPSSSEPRFTRTIPAIYNQLFQRVE